jgi:hypothetical protein
MAWVLTDYMMEQMLLELSECGASAPFSGVLCATYVGLVTAPLPALNRGMLLANFVEAAFPGYVRQLLTWRLPYFSEAGLWVLEAVCDHWQPTGSDAGQLIVGVIIATAATNGQLLAATALPSPGIDMSSPQDALTGIVRFGLDPNGNWGDFTAVD